jgi:hypothetical protein
MLQLILITLVLTFIGVAALSLKTFLGKKDVKGQAGYRVDTSGGCGCGDCGCQKG